MCKFFKCDYKIIYVYYISNHKNFFMNLNIFILFYV
uniref:Uncharacterized protein n=1 Tax=Dasyclonium flaccidum TaxID=2007274 RepID=A0A1Z1MLM0_9FLOR|nr:hypothetical protein [Dasyclonium flaccidum]ARW66695.1 hypothetical protein [Dasyclonium flaccidum]